MSRSSRFRDVRQRRNFGEVRGFSIAEGYLQICAVHVVADPQEAHAQIFMDSSRLTLAEVLELLTSLGPVG